MNTKCISASQKMYMYFDRRALHIFQDHDYSDSLSLHVTTKITPKATSPETPKGEAGRRSAWRTGDSFSQLLSAFLSFSQLFSLAAHVFSAFFSFSQLFSAFFTPYPAFFRFFQLFSGFFSFFQVFVFFQFLQSDRSTHRIRFIRYRTSIRRMNF